MRLKLLTVLALAATIASPAIGQERAGRTRRPDNNANQEQRPRERERAGRERAVPRAEARRENPEPRNVQPPPSRPVQPAPQVRRDYGRDNDRRYDGRYDGRRYDHGRAVPRRYYAPRLVRPTVVRVIPYRPYVYRPSYSAGVIYGTGGYYPFGYTPRGYYDPIPGRPYGGLRITDAPRYARVFADGYYVGLVNDFDGIFQHLNLEAGPHRIEIQDDGYGAIAFDVYIRPGETITYRAGW
jgi:hypothetical protein